jgi:hypothetical protein
LIWPSYSDVVSFKFLPVRNVVSCKAPTASADIFAFLVNSVNVTSVSSLKSAKVPYLSFKAVKDSFNFLVVIKLSFEDLAISLSSLFKSLASLLDIPKLRAVFVVVWSISLRTFNTPTPIAENSTNGSVKF